MYGQVRDEPRTTVRMETVMHENKGKGTLHFQFFYITVRQFNGQYELEDVHRQCTARWTYRTGLIFALDGDLPSQASLPHVR